MKSLIIGADVGGTNTDVVCMHDKTVIAFEKVPTTDDITTGLQMAISNTLNKLPKGEWSVTMVNIGTTHFVNALVQRIQLAPVAVVRLCGPSSVDFGPFDDYPDDLSAVIGAKCYFVNGGYQVDGSIITEVDEEEIIPVIQELKDSKIENIVISGIFSPVNNNQEKQVEQIFRKHYSGVSLTLSSDVGSIGLLERGNAAILNESFKPLCHRIISALSLALRELKLDCPFFFTQNDGTLVSPVGASDFPIKIMGCGAANSIRGASHLSGIQNGFVIDIGGTTTDIGSLNGGFPRQTSSVVSKAGLVLNCTMPDVLSIRLGGGSVVCPKPLINSIKVDVGPKSVGHTLTEAALTFGGSTLTATDVASAYLKVDVGDRDKVKVTTSVLEEANEVIQCMLEESVDRMKLSKEAVRVICVGGGSILRDKNRKVPGVTEFIQPPYYQVANAVGAALCQVSGCEEILLNMTGLSKTEALEKLRTRAFEKCLMNGAKRESIRVIEEDIGKMHLPGNITGAKVKVVGDLTDEALIKSKETTSAFLHSTHNLEPAVPKFQRVSHYLDEDPIQPQVPQIDEKTGEWILSEYDVQCISIGTAILGCGGGGNPRIGGLRVRQAMKNGHKVRVIHPERLNAPAFKDGRVGMPALMGAPGVAIEKLYSGKDITEALTCLDKIMNSDLLEEGSQQKKKLKVQTTDEIQFVTDFDPAIVDETKTNAKHLIALMGVEMGGINAMEPLCTGALMNLPVLDCDGMGRAFPELQMLVPSILGKPLHPTVLVDNNHREAILWADGPKSIENQFRNVLGTIGYHAAIALSPVSPAEVSETCIMFTISRCFRLGDAVLKARKEQRDTVKAICDYENGIHLISGKIADVSRNTLAGFDRGFVVIGGTGKFAGQEVIVEFQNENVKATKRTNGVEKVLVTTPDLIAIVYSAMGTAITTEDVRYGLRVAVIAFASAPQLRTEAALKIVGPRAFNYDLDFNPIGEYGFTDPIPTLP